MKFCLIMSKDGLYPTEAQMKELKKYGEVQIIVHEGKLSELSQLKKDTSEKILAVDPDSFQWDMDGESVKDIPNVKAVCTQSTSYDWVKPKILKEFGIHTINCAGFSSDSVAEYAITMAVDVARKLPLLIKNMWKIDWAASKPMLLKGKKLGVVGLGKIGTRIAEVGQGIGMNVIYWSKNTRNKKFAFAELEELFKTADVIIPALSENDETKKIITHELIDTVKPTSSLVGMNRIKILWDEEYILKKVARKEIAGYAFEGENAKELSNYEGNVWSLPPMSWYSQDSLNNLLRVWVDNMILVAKGTPQNIVA